VGQGLPLCVWGSAHQTSPDPPVFSQGIQWTPVEFFDNTIICNLIESVSCPQSQGPRSGSQLPPTAPGATSG